MKFTHLLTRFLLLSCFCFATSASGQNMQFVCGSNTIIDVEAFGLLDDSDNCVNIPSGNGMVGALVEVWIEEGDCGRPLPNSIIVSAGGQNLVANGISVTQTSSSNFEEYIYRVYVPGNYGQVCIGNLNGCRDATSIAIYTERQAQGASSFQATYDSEFHNNGCIQRTFNIGASSINRDFTLSVPIHEKSDDGREVVIEVDVRDGNSTLNTITRTFTNQNRGEEASLYNIDIDNVPTRADNFRLRVCSPSNNGDSFGVGSVFVGTDLCDSNCDIRCPNNVTVQCDESIQPSSTGEPELIGSTCSSALVTFTDDFNSASCPSIGTITRTWRVTSQAAQNQACVPMRLAYYDFTDNGRNLCSVNGGDPLQRGAPVTERNRQTCNHSVTRVTKERSCLLYTSPSPRDATLSRMPSSA